MQLTPLTEAFGAEVTGVDLRQPQPPETIAAIRSAWQEHGVLLFRGPVLTADEHIAFSRNFGPLDVHLHQRKLNLHPEIIILSNIVEDGVPVGSYNCALSWHTDGTHLMKPAVGSLLHCVVRPESGGETEFASTAAAYDDLDDATKAQIEGRAAIHSFARLQRLSFPDRPLDPDKKKLIPDLLQPIVWVHAETGRRALYLGEHIIAGVEGMDPEDGIALINRLRDHATSPKYVYHHNWREGDLIFWDNRTTLHRALFLDAQRHQRRLHRTTLSGMLETGRVCPADVPRA